MFDTLNILGKQAYREQNFYTSDIYFKKALEVATKNKSYLEIAKINNNIGIIEDIKGNYPEALEYYRKTLSYCVQQKDNKGLEKVLNNIGIVYEELKMYENALNYFKRSLDIKNKRPKRNLICIANTYNNVANIYENYLQKADSALYYYKLALKNYEHTNYYLGKGMTCSNIGLVYFRKKKFKKADSCFLSALSIFNKVQNQEGIASVLLYQANLDIEQNTPSKALEHLNNAYAISNKIGITSLKTDITNSYATVFERINKSDSALKYYKQYHQLYNQLINAEKITKIKNLEQRIEMDHKDYEIELLKKDQEINKLKQNKQSILILTLLFILVSIVIVFYQIIHKKNIKNKMELSKAKTRLLRTQMSPHFLFNSLMSIQTFLMEGDVKGASKYLTLLARLMRLLLTYSRESYITIEQELEIIEYYLETEKLRFGDKINYLINVDPNIDKYNTYIPPLMIQPALENAITHGLMHCKTNGELTISFKKENNELTVIIEDTGVGYKAAGSTQINKKKSFSTDIIKERIQLIKRQFGQNINYHIEEKNPESHDCPGTRVIFRFQLDY